MMSWLRRKPGARKEQAAREAENWARLATAQSMRAEAAANAAENRRRAATGEPRLNPCDHDDGTAALPTDAELDDYLYRQIVFAIGLYRTPVEAERAAMLETLRRFRAGEHMDLPESQAWAEANRRKPREQAPGGEGP